jgi:hypothetical protein
LTNRIQRGVMNLLGASVGTCLALLAFIKRKASMASSTSLAAGAARNLSTSRNSGA